MENRLLIAVPSLIDEYSQHCRELFIDARTFQSFQHLLDGMLSDLPRTSLPAIGRLLGLADSQGLNYFLTRAVWDLKALRKKRLSLLQQLLSERSMLFCITINNIPKKGDKTDYLGRYYCPSSGRYLRGLTSINLYGVVDGISFPLSFRVFKPENKLRENDIYQTKDALVMELLEEVEQIGFTPQVVMLEHQRSNYEDIFKRLEESKVPFMVTSLMEENINQSPFPKEKSWQLAERLVKNNLRLNLHIRKQQSMKSQRHNLHQLELIEAEQPLFINDAYHIQTNNVDAFLEHVEELYLMAQWRGEHLPALLQSLGWSDFRLTNYDHIERFWEMVFHAYTISSLQGIGIGIYTSFSEQEVSTV